MMRIVSFLILLITMNGLTACGQSGGLYLPQQTSPQHTVNDKVANS